MADLLIPIVKKSLIPGVESRTPNITTAKKLRADRLVSTRSSTEEMVVDFSNVAPMDAKGQMWVYDGTGQVATLNVGTEGQVLRVHSAATEGVEWSNDPTTLLNADGEILTFNSSLNTAVVLPHPGAANAGYVLSATNPAVNEPGIAWTIPSLRIAGTSVINNTAAPLLGATDTITLRWMYITANSIRVEVPQASFTAQSSSNLLFDLPVTMPLPISEQRLFLVTANGATIADSLLILNPTAGVGQMVTITPNRNQGGLTPTFTALNICKIYGFTFEYLIN